MRGNILIPYKKADFLLEAIKELERQGKCQIRDYDDYPEVWYDSFKAGISNAICVIQRHIEKTENLDDG